MVDAGCESTATLYNPYEGQKCGRQLSETVEEFLKRIPPSTTQTTTDIPWIYIANPFVKRPNIISEAKPQGLASEGPPGENSDWAEFVERGESILGELSWIGQSKSSARAIKSHTQGITQKLLDTAAELHCTTGKVRDPISALLSMLLNRLSGCCFARPTKLMPSGIRLLVPRPLTSLE